MEKMYIHAKIKRLLTKLWTWEVGIDYDLVDNSKKYAISFIYIIFFSSEQCRPDEQLRCSTTAHATVATSFDKCRATPTSRLRCTISRQRSLQRSDVAPIQLCGAAVKAAPAASAGVATIQQQQQLQQLHKQTHIYIYFLELDQ